MFFFFKPMKLQENKNIDIASVEVYDFIIHELTPEGLSRVINGTKAYIYKDTYNIINVNYTDASDNKISNIVAKKGIYKDRIITLKGDVKYTRDDNIVLESQSLTYDEKNSILTTNDRYIMYNAQNKITGTSFKLNNKLEKVYSKNVHITYNIEDN